MAMTEATMLKRIRARNDFNTVLARAGFTRTALAQAAGVSPRTVDSMANPAGYGREGYTKELTAWKVAKGFARLLDISEDEAYARLFIEEAE
jgi:DNA-binding XRE family transcriptional regulator